jgi:L-serine dehydratase
VPYPFANAKEMLAMAAKSGLSIAEMKRANEESFDVPRGAGRGPRRASGQAMKRLHRARPLAGRHHAGRPEGARRARRLHDKLQEDWRTNRPNPLLANDWLSIYAMAVNEENAAGGRVVTAPTNGAAGVVPAVLHYWRTLRAPRRRRGRGRLPADRRGDRRLYQANASISGAEVGCQGEVGRRAPWPRRACAR